MMKKVLLVLITALSFLFYSCGSTKQTVESEPLEPTELTEQDDISLQPEDQSIEQEQNESEETQTPEEEIQTEQENIDLRYPPLEEIEDPELIEITPEDIEEEALAAAKEAEQNENKITEPVVEEEELPPLPVTETEDNTETTVSELVEGLEGPQEDETQENLEPTIEVQTEEEAEPEPEILPSRSVSLKKGETLVITYPGSGWIYMGSTSEYNNLASRGRKLGTTDTKYTLLAKEAGTQIHHFYKIDNLTGEYIDDYIEVTVLEKKGSSSTVVNAPDYSEVVPKKPETPAKATPKTNPVQKSETTEQTTQDTTTQTSVTPTDTTTKTSAATTKTATKTATTTTSPKKDEVIEIEPEETVIVIEEEEQIPDLEPLLEKARTGVSSKKYDDAYTALTQYLEFSTDNRDEALYLLGQLLESDSQYKNIKQAVETYQTLCDSYPASKYWEQANKRIVYLKRFYINIH